MSSAAAVGVHQTTMNITVAVRNPAVRAADFMLGANAMADGEERQEVPMRY